MNNADMIALGGLALTVAVMAIQALHFVLSLQNRQALSDVKAQIAVQVGDLRIYMHERFVTKDELAQLIEKLERQS